MRSVRTVPVLSAILVLAAMVGCGDDDPTTPPRPPAPEELAYFEFHSGAGSQVVADAAELAFSVGPDGADFKLMSVTVTGDDAGRTIPIDPADHPDFAEAVLLLTNGANDGTAFGRAPVGGGSAITRSDEETAFAGGVLADQEPDFAGAEITGVLLVLDAVTIASPGRDPNSDGKWTDVTVQGRVVILGHP